MLNDPNDVMNHIQPFFPHDPSLAILAISKLFPNMPMWISEMIVFEFFQTLGIHEAFQEHVKRITQYDHIISGKSRELQLPMDLSQVLSLN